ncbi:MAG: hypothetical protein DI547_08715 [Sphingobium sp.]|jgi:hypothetical protein|nr:MAG: hypothetical protein DI547_08715 [Sphingobium sp.]
MAEPELIAGALAGWQRIMTGYGCVLTLQVGESEEQFETHEYQRVLVAMNDRQLRSLARDLQRAAEARGINLWARETGLFRFFRRRKLPEVQDVQDVEPLVQAEAG